MCSECGWDQEYETYEGSDSGAYTVEIVTGTDEVKPLRTHYASVALAESKARRIFHTFETDHLFGWEVVIRDGDGKVYSRQVYQ